MAWAQRWRFKASTDAQGKVFSSLMDFQAVQSKARGRGFPGLEGLTERERERERERPPFAILGSLGLLALLWPSRGTLATTSN